MRILQVVPYISPDGAFGGPTRVALNQSKSLRNLGHEVVLAAAAGGFDESLPEEFDGQPVRLFPGRRILPKGGFAGLTSPGLLSWLTKAIPMADVVHVHMARDLVTLPAAAMTLLAGKPLIVQTHGMVDESSNPLSGPVDRLLTVPVLRKASKVLVLTSRERDDLAKIAGEKCAFDELVNGVEVGDLFAKEQVKGADKTLEVLYLARLHPRKRPSLFAEMSIKLAPNWPNARWRIVGPDEGEGSKVINIIERSQFSNAIKWEGALPPGRTLARMRKASVYVLPAINEPFGMTVIEAMSIGVPVVVTRSCGLAEFVETSQGGIVCDDSSEGLCRAVETLIRNSEIRLTMGKNARLAVEQNYSMDKVASRLARMYESCEKGKKGWE